MQVTGIILNEDGEVINDQETTDDDEGSVPIMFDNPKNGNAGDDDDCVTVAETIRTLRDDSSVVANRSVMAEIEDGEEVAEEGEVEEIEKGGNHLKLFSSEKIFRNLSRSFVSGN